MEKLVKMSDSLFIKSLLYTNVQTVEPEDEKPAKVRRHLPPGTGEFSVGCVDIMSDNSDTGVFFRLFYPIEKTDIYVSIYCIVHVHAHP